MRNLGANQAPGLNTPLSLRLLLIACLITLVALLMFAVARQLQDGAPHFRWLDALAAVAYGAGPVIVATLIAANSAWSRLAIVSTAAAITVHACGSINISSPIEQGVPPASLLCIALFGGVIYWLYRSRKLRIYYAIIAAKPIPTDLADRADVLLSPGAIERWVSRFSSSAVAWLEWVLVVLIFGFVYVSFFALEKYNI
ncbi:MAG: hypothetical protein AAF004_12635 [Pseudomonadota bacterium]